MFARGAASVPKSVRQIPRYRPRSLRLRSLATAALQHCPIEQELVASFDHPFDAPSSSTSSTGLFGHRLLSSHDGFSKLAHATLLRAHLLTERIIRARSNRDELFKVVKNLDRLSDILCSVIDLAELVRNSHPDERWVESANDVYEHLCEYMNVLNTSEALHDVRPS